MKIFGFKTKSPMVVIFIIGLYVMGIAMLVGLLLDNEYLKKEAIDHKYCYLEIDNKIENVNMTESKDQALRNLHFYVSLILDRPSILYTTEPSRRLSIDKKYEVLEYTKDSLLVKLRLYTTTRRGGNEYAATGYVPFLTLHDSLPDCHPNCEKWGKD